MNQAEVLEILAKYGAVVTNGHFVYTSGKHGAAYVDKDAVYPNVEDISRLCFAMAEPFSILEKMVEVVVGPAMGGIILSQHVAEHLGQLQGNNVLSIYAEKDSNGEFSIGRRYDKLLPEKTVLVVEDNLTTGGSVKKVVEVVRRLGGNVVGVSAICNRGDVSRTDVGSVQTLKALVDVPLDAWDEANCPLCKAGIPINTDLGKGREFLARREGKGIQRNFRDLIENKWSEGKFVCVGLDSDHTKIPKSVLWDASGQSARVLRFNKAVIEATKDIAGCYKINSAFYEALGSGGVATLFLTLDHIHKASSVPVIVDAKRSDIGNTNNGYADFLFNYLRADATTVHPYLGKEALVPFLERKEKGVFVLCRTSNAGAGEFQDLDVEIPKEEALYLLDSSAKLKLAHSSGSADRYGTKLYRHVAYRVAMKWNAHRNCGVVAGATYPEELESVRQIVGEMPILIPGIGTQGGNLEKTIAAGRAKNGGRIIVNSSSGIIFASSEDDFAEAARRETQKLHDAITALMQK